MENKLSLRQYEVYVKGNAFRVVIFSDISNIYCYDAYPTEDDFEIDGNIDAMKYLLMGFCEVLRNPNILIYLPIKKTEDTHHVVMYGNKIKNFKPSVWYKIKKCFKLRNRISDYIISIENFNSEEYLLNSKDTFFKQEVLGDTVFMRLPETDLVFYINSIQKIMKDMNRDSTIMFQYWGLGYASYGSRNC